MNKDKYYFEILDKYQEALIIYEKLFKTFTYVVKEINELEKVYVIEDTFVIYIGIRDYYCDSSTESRELKVEKNHYNYERDITNAFLLVFEELTYNGLFKVNASKLKREIGGNPSYCIYKFFDGGYGNPIEQLNAFAEQNEYCRDVLYKSKFDFVNTNFPEIHLKQRIDEWEGKPYYFVIYKIKCENFLGYAVASTTSGFTTKFALTVIKDIEKSIYKYFLYNPNGFNELDENDDFFYTLSHENGVSFFPKNPILNEHGGFVPVCWNTPAFKKAMLLLLEKYCKESKIDPRKSNKRHYKFIPNDVLEYWVFEDFWKEKLLNEKYIEILRNVGKYISQANYSTKYSILENKWKSEELVYKCAKTLFNKNEVIWQYRPYFLGQLSYDVFVCGENIAIEYQGKQHFEPVEFFGGEEHFIKQIERDNRKKKIE